MLLYESEIVGCIEIERCDPCLLLIDLTSRNCHGMAPFFDGGCSFIFTFDACSDN